MFKLNSRTLVRILLIVLSLVLVTAIGAQDDAAEDYYANIAIETEGEVDVASYAKEGPYRIGFSNGFSGNSWRRMMLASLEIEIENHEDIEELIVLDGQGDVTKQINDIESLIAQEVDAIMVIPNSGTALLPVLREAMSLGIAVVPFNLPVEGEDYTAYVGVDPARKGERWGEWLVETLDEGSQIVALGGLPGNSYTATAWGAAEPIITEGGIEVITFRDAYWEEDRARVIMSDLLAANPEIDGIWADGGQVATGALKAMLAANRDMVPVTGDDYHGVLSLYNDNGQDESTLNFFLISEPTWESVIALRVTLSILRGEETARLNFIDPVPITTDNWADYYNENYPDSVFFDTPLPEDVLLEIFGEDAEASEEVESTD